MEQKIKEKEEKVFVDYTQKLEEIATQLSQNEFLAEEKFSLFDAMQASQLCDEKMDFKMGLEKCDTLERMLKSGKIKKPEELELNELLCLFDTVSAFEMIWLQGQSLSETTFTFAYIYDDSVAAQNASLNALVQNIHYLGNVAFNFVRRTNFMNEEDYIACFFGFK